MITRKRITKWRELQGKGMESAVGEYTPAEFWELLHTFESARDAFLDMIADAHSFEAQYDGDQDGGSTSYMLHVGEAFERLAEELGISPHFMEHWHPAIMRTITEETKG